MSLRLALLAILFCVPATLALDLESLLPDRHGGFSASPEGPYFYLSSENMTDLYDGGYLTYVDGGVLSALLQVYSRDSSYFSLILHETNSEANASEMVNHFRQILSNSGTTGIPLGNGGFECSTGGVDYLYFSQGKLFTSLEGVGEDVRGAMEEAAQDVARKSVSQGGLLFPLLVAVIPGFREGGKDYSSSAEC